MTEVLPVLPHQLTQNVKLLHKVALVHQGLVLLLKRSSSAESRPGCWDLPGGNSEWPATTTLPSADIHRFDVMREIAEETGLTVGDDYFLGKNPIFFRTFFEPEKQIYTVICGWSVTAQELKTVGEFTAFNPQSVVLSSEHTEFAWVPQEKLSEYDFGGVKGDFVVRIAEAGLQR